MATIVLQGGARATPEVLREWVAVHPVKVRHYLAQDDLKIRLADLADEWQEAAAANPSKEVREFVRLILEDFARIVDNIEEG